MGDDASGVDFLGGAQEERQQGDEEKQAEDVAGRRISGFVAEREGHGAYAFDTPWREGTPDLAERQVEKMSDESADSARLVDGERRRATAGEDERPNRIGAGRVETAVGLCRREGFRALSILRHGDAGKGDGVLTSLGQKKRKRFLRDCYTSMDGASDPRRDDQGRERHGRRAEADSHPRRDG